MPNVVSFETDTRPGNLAEHSILIFIWLIFFLSLNFEYSIITVSAVDSIDWIQPNPMPLSPVLEDRVSTASIFRWIPVEPNLCQSWSRWVWPVVFRWQGNPCSSCGFGRLNATFRASNSKKNQTILHTWVQFHFPCFMPGCVQRSRHGNETLSWHECGGMGKSHRCQTILCSVQIERYAGKKPLYTSFAEELPWEALCESPCKTAGECNIYIYIYLYIDDLSAQHMCSLMPGGAMSLAWTLRYGPRPKRKSHGAHPSAPPLFPVETHLYTWYIQYMVVSINGCIWIFLSGNSKKISKMDELGPPFMETPMCVCGLERMLHAIYWR